MRSWALLVVCAASVFAFVSGYPNFRDQIPNGHGVPHPCQPDSTWAGVGHLSVGGGGDRNVFGVDFKAAGNQWTPALCQQDSDGDGRTNGQELGDPLCHWKVGATPDVTTGISHPGVCEPIDSAVCRSRPVPSSSQFSTQKDWTDAACQQSSTFQCEGLEEAKNVTTFDLRNPYTRVPSKETTYICSTFAFPDVSKDYHVIASTPIINNTDVMHHMLLFGCADDTPTHGPQEECNMGACSSLIVAWGAGGTGSCLHEEAGIRVGATGYKKMMIQYHWNNPRHVETYMDSSGLRLHYTPHLRPNDLAVLMIGQTYLHIPPRSPDVVVTSDCTAACTNNLMKGDIHVTEALNHMHLTGKGQSIEHLRDGKHVRYITNEDDYRYDQPRPQIFTEALTIQPGDVLRTTCHFNSLERNTTTEYGDGTQQEMCYGFLSFFPAANMPHHECKTWKTLSSDNCDVASYQGCDIDAFHNGTLLKQSQFFKGIMAVCDPFGECKPECRTAIRAAKQREPCMRNEDVWTGFKWGALKATEEGWQLLAALSSCAVNLALEDARAAAGPGQNSENAVRDNGASHVTSPVVIATVAMATFSVLLTSLRR